MDFIKIYSSYWTIAQIGRYIKLNEKFEFLSIFSLHCHPESLEEAWNFFFDFDSSSSFFGWAVSDLKKMAYDERKLIGKLMLILNFNTPIGFVHENQ